MDSKFKVGDKIRWTSRRGKVVEGIVEMLDLFTDEVYVCFWSGDTKGINYVWLEPERIIPAKEGNRYVF